MEMIDMAEFGEFTLTDLRPFIEAIDRSVATLAAGTIPQRVPDCEADPDV